MNITVKRVGDWKKADQILKALPNELARALDEAVIQEAEYLRGRIIRKFNKVGPPLASTTLLTKRKGGSKPLQASGDYKGSIAVVTRGPAQAFIGVPRSAKNGRFKLARIHEEGVTVVQRMTEKQRKFLHAVLPRTTPTGAGAGVSTGVIVIRIPPRPVIKPTIDEEAPKVPERLANRIAQRLEASGALGGKGGRRGGSSAGGGGTTPDETGTPAANVGAARDRSAAARKGWETRRKKAGGK